MKRETNDSLYSTPSVGKRGYSIFMKLVSGGMSGVVSRTACAPFSRLSVLQETRVSVQSAGNLIVAEKNNIYQTLRSIYQKDGLIGFFRGNLVDIFRSIPYSAINYGVYELVSIRLHAVDDKHLAIQHLISGGTAGMCAVIFTYPFDMLKTRVYISQMGTTNSVLKSMHTGFTDKGLKSFYKGMGINLISVIPNMALSFTSYEYIRKWLRQHTNLSIMWVSMFSGALSGCFANTITFPLHLVQRNLQIAGMGTNVMKYKSAWECIKFIYSRNGICGFYSGLIPQYLKTIPKCAISFCIYEVSKQLCGV